MLPNTSSSKLLRALWKRSHTFPPIAAPFPSLHHSARPVASVTSFLLSYRCARPAVCMRCSRPVPHFVAAFSTSASTSTSTSAGPTPCATSSNPSTIRTQASLPPRPPRPSRQPSSPSEELRDRNRRLLQYVAAVAIFALGASYAAVPLYRLFCQVRQQHNTIVLTISTIAITSVSSPLTPAPLFLFASVSLSTRATAAPHSAH